jgi:hypothetical protein
MRSKSRSTISDVNARDPGGTSRLTLFYPQCAGLKRVTLGTLRGDRAKSIVPGSSGVTSADEIAMSEENDGVLENLPRSRPGVRSDKRASSKRAGGVGAAAGSPPAPAARASTKARTRRAAKPRTKARAEPPLRPPPATRAPTDPIGAALKAGEAVALTGLKVAGRVAGEVLRRLPRP